MGRTQAAVCYKSDGSKRAQDVIKPSKTVEIGPKIEWFWSVSDPSDPYRHHPLPNVGPDLSSYSRNTGFDTTVGKSRVFQCVSTSVRFGISSWWIIKEPVRPSRPEAAVILPVFGRQCVMPLPALGPWVWAATGPPGRRDGSESRAQDGRDSRNLGIWDFSKPATPLV